MAHGPKSKQRRARKTREANRLAQAIYYRGAGEVVHCVDRIGPYEEEPDAEEMRAYAAAKAAGY